LRILLSAYACEPDKGSEPGVGWHWAVEIAKRGHEVWVLTRENNRAVIEAAPDSKKPNLHFEYYDLPGRYRVWKKGQRGVHLYYLIWQLQALRRARTLHKRIGFDVVHHVTFGVFRQPSFMWRLRIASVVGPVGGGDRVPLRLRYGLGWQGCARDFIRDLVNRCASADPLVRMMFKKAQLVFVKTSQTLDYLPRQARNRAVVSPELGVEGPSLDDTDREPSRAEYRVLYVGRFVYLKGCHLALRAFARLVEVHPYSRFTLIGSGSEEARWRRLASSLGIGDRVDFQSWMSHESLLAHYSSYNVLLFPSLRDSSGNVILEAMSRGLPVVCLGLGGPPLLVNDRCGRVIDCQHAGESEVVQRLADALIEFALSPQLWHEASLGALAQSSRFTWESAVDRVYSVVEGNRAKA
jgi:glycosyltransferase involved in cell wall biosynthesis